MHLTSLLLLTLLALLPCATPLQDSIPVSKIRTLTLRSPSQTTSRRLPPIPQLKCISPAPLCALSPIDVMRCTNQGSSYDPSDVEWSCKAELPPELRLGSTEVLCEGYSGPEDPYVLKGSCGVEYRVVLTAEGERRYPELLNQREGSSSFSLAFGVLFVGILAWILYSAFTAAPRRPRPARGGGGGGFWPGDGPGGWGPGGWGPGWGDGDDPPPPYPGYKAGDNAWRPGFWTGLVGGAGAGYLAGRRGQDRGEWMGGRGWDRRDREDVRRRAGGSSMGPRYESTGFGSTTRR